MNPTSQTPTSNPETHAKSAARREFLKGSAAAGVAAVASSLPIASFAQVAGSDELKVGIVGIGGRGSGAVVQTLNVDGCRLVAAGDLFKEKIQGLNRIKQQLEQAGKGARFDVKPENQYDGFDAYKHVIDKCDLVILSTPPGFRPEMFEAAINAGKHVFMEKPVCTDAHGYNRIIKAAQMADQKGLKVVVGLQRRFHPSYLEAFKKVREEGIIGDIVSAQCYWNGTRPWTRQREEGESELHFQLRNWYHFAWICGDHICEQHVHNIDVINWFVGGGGDQGAHPVSAQGMGSRSGWEDPKSGEIFDHHHVEFRYANGVVMNSQCRHIKGCKNRIEEEIYGTKGMITLDQGKAIAMDRKGNEIWRFSGPGASAEKRDRRRNEGGPNPYQIEHDELHAAIRQKQPLNNAYWGADSTFTACLGRLATYSGQEVRWDDAVKSDFCLVPDNMTWDTPAPVQPNPDGTYKYALPGQTKLPWA